MPSQRLVSWASAALAVSLLATGCGGGGGGGSTSPTIPASSTTASLTIVIPPIPAAQSHNRKPAYVSPYTTSMQITIDNVNGSSSIPPGFAPTTTYNLTTGSGGDCTAGTGGNTCTVKVPAPAGDIVYTFTILNAAGKPLATATKLLTIIKGEANNLSVVLNGIVASVKLVAPALSAGVKTSGALTVNAYDASGALIDASAPYASPILLTDNDTTLSTHLQLGSNIGPTAQVNEATDVVTFIYNGNPDLGPFTITAAVGTTVVSTLSIGAAQQVISFSNTTADTLSPTDINYYQPTIYFATVSTPSAPVTATTTATEAGYGGTFTAVLDQPTCFPTTGQVATISSSPATTFTVSPLNPGICKVVVTDSAARSSFFWVSVTTGVVGVSSRMHHIVK